jgi:hypothetical protein
VRACGPGTGQDVCSGRGTCCLSPYGVARPQLPTLSCSHGLADGGTLGPRMYSTIRRATRIVKTASPLSLIDDGVILLYGLPNERHCAALASVWGSEWPPRLV